MRVPVSNARPRYGKNDLTNNPMWDPLYHCTRTMVAFAQGLFKHLPPGQLHWSPNLEETEIVITDQTPLTLSTIGQRPAIVIIPGQAQFANLAIGNLEDIDHQTGNRIHRDLISSSITYNCISRNGVEAGRIAWYLGSHVKKLRVFLQQQGPFTEIGQTVVFAPETPPGAIVPDAVDSSAINRAVIVPYQYPHRWEVQDPLFQLETIRATIKGEDDTVLSETQIPNE